jgi:L-alanine-DL-glutamate epimerase-like enolase superfamily enzyme
MSATSAMKLTHDIVSIRQREAFATNKGVVTETRQAIVQLAWEGRTGLGTILLGRAPKLAEDQIESVLETARPVMASATPFAMALCRERLADARIPAAAASGLDMAAHDLLGKLTGLRCRDLLGLAGLPIAPTGLSLGVMSAPELLERVGRYKDWPILKLKMTAATDVNVVGQVRSEYAGRIWVDGNGCWDAATAVDAARKFADWGVELLEQPVPPGQIESLRSVRENSPIPIVADEDSTGPVQVGQLVGAVDAVAIKLHRCGGIGPALEMIAVARASGLKVMLGCVSESALGVTAAAQLAGLADYIDLDGSVNVANDPFRGISIKDGRVILPDGPGFGVARSVGV